MLTKKKRQKEYCSNVETQGQILNHTEFSEKENVSILIRS